jgi:hypothetical protein
MSVSVVLDAAWWRKVLAVAYFFATFALIVASHSVA